MPRDIRSYFQTAKTNSNFTPVKTTKRRISSSDEEDAETQTPLKPTKRTKTAAKSSVSSNSDSDGKQKKIISPADIFGKKSIKRQEAPKVSRKLRKKEAKAHDDANFEDTLSQLDTSEIEQNYLLETEPDKVNDEKMKTPTKSKDQIKEQEMPEKLKNVETNGEKHEVKKRKHSSSPLSKEIDHQNVEPSKTSKNAKKSPKSKTTVSNIEIEHEHLRKEASPKKTKISDVYEERAEKRKQHAAMYQQYLHRGGARHPGSKNIPVGANNCLAGLSFLITGVLDSLEREEAEELIKKYGGRILHQVSKKTDYVIVGDEPGPSKMSKAKSLNIKEISEDDLLEMIRTRPTGQTTDIKQSRTKSNERMKQKSTEDKSPSPSKNEKNINQETKKSPSKVHSPRKKECTEEETKESIKHSLHKKSEDKDRTKTEKLELFNKDVKTDIKESLFEDKNAMNDQEGIQIKTVPSKDINENLSVQALVEKYRPKTMKQILGQQGDKSNAKKLYTWLMNWHKNQKGPVKPAKPSPWAKNDDGAFFKAALLSGPPGIGKTTTVQVVCKELGFDLVEFNASDTRSKKLLQEEVSELLSNTSLKDYFIDTKNKPSSKHVLLMDEVDGMAGNEDRGGLQELISLIKSTEVPIICVCNDRNNPKMRTLANYTFDLRFQKPRLEQIRGAMKSICFKENVNISTEDLDRLIESTNSDIRQVINHLALFAGMSNSQEKSEKKHVNKDLKLGPWDVVRKVFSAEEHKNMSIHEKSDLFFHDYNIASLFVQENYLLVIPKESRNKLLDKVAKSAESLALGDIVEKSIRSNGAWSLLPVQACYSSVIPGTIMSGHISGQINFPSWLGRNSKAGKFDRLMQQITLHTRLATGVSKEAINLDYIKPLRDAIIRPLAINGTEGIDATMNVMNHYHLLREDLDSLIEISLWPGDRDPMQLIDSKVKAAFTRTYNKNSVAVPYIVSGTSKKKSAQTMQDEDILDEDEGEEANSDEDDDNVEIDKMIKAKKPTTSKQTESKAKSNDKTKTKPKSNTDKSSKRGRGRGRGRGK
ncbi:germ line transcription factor 1 [Calliopsis andreniformis]|uniref:germ line transcription factor 1 n=1 Tax=Calliopsis andreniformis TaxID=337506 RepID=UPI003FCD57B4